MTPSATVIVLAKAPVAGRSKTRLTPPCRPEQAASLAAAALRDTCEAVAAVAEIQRLLVLDGVPGPWLPGGFEVIAQCDGDLADRLGDAFTHVDGPALLVGMDTPQISATSLRGALAVLAQPGVDAVLGPATDGGFWAIGFNQPAPGAFDRVPMSVDTTLSHQRRRLADLGLRVADLATLRDVDDFADAADVAAAAPRSHFAIEFALVAAATMALS